MVYFNPDMHNLTKVIDKIESNGTIYEVIEYNRVSSRYTESTVNSVYPKKLRQVRILLNGNAISTEAGALQYHKGNIEMEIPKTSVKGIFNGMMTNESITKPKYIGSGEIYLEPSFNYYIMIEIENEEVVVDKGMFCCCDGSIEISAQIQKNISTAVAGGEGLFHLKLKGTGTVVLSSPAPLEEIVVYQLNNDKLKVDGNYAVMRRGNIEFAVEKSNKSLFGAAVNGEGFLSVFKGTGEVWLIPTLKYMS